MQFVYFCIPQPTRQRCLAFLNRFDESARDRDKFPKEEKGENKKLEDISSNRRQVRNASQNDGVYVCVWSSHGWRSSLN